MARVGSSIYSITTSIQGYQGATLPARAVALQSVYASPDLDIIDGLYTALSQAQNAAQGFASYQRSVAQANLIQMVAEAPDPPLNLTLQASLAYLVAAMQTASATVKRNTVSATVTYGSNTGNGVVAAGVLSNLGLPLEYVFAEILSGVISRDAQSGGAVAGQESLTFSGQTPVTNQLSYLWPAGSGATFGTTAVNAAAPNGRGTANLLYNGNMELWTVLANIPDGFHLGVGTAGTTILQSTGQFYDGASSLSFVGTSSEHTSVQTRFGTDFKASAAPLTQYAVNLWAKVDVVPAAGVLSVELVDGSGTQLLDAQGNASVFTVSLPGLTTSWAAINGFLRTPRVLPSQVWLRLRLSTALSTGSTLFMDRCALCQPNSAYFGGVPIAAFSGNVNWVQGDTAFVTVANAFNGILQSNFDRLFSMRNNGLILPSTAGSPTLADGTYVV
jgi:hypothetical protein